MYLYREHLYEYIEFSALNSHFKVQLFYINNLMGCIIKILLIFLYYKRNLIFNFHFFAHSTDFEDNLLLVNKDIKLKMNGGLWWLFLLLIII